MADPGGSTVEEEEVVVVMGEKESGLSKTGAEQLAPSGKSPSANDKKSRRPSVHDMYQDGHRVDQGLNWVKDTTTAPSLHCHGTIAAPSLGHRRTIAEPSRHHRGTIAVP